MSVSIMMSMLLIGGIILVVLIALAALIAVIVMLVIKKSREKPKYIYTQAVDVQPENTAPVQNGGQDNNNN